MPVDKFGHTDSSSVQRVTAGGVTLTQINNTFMRLDGSNALTGNLKLGGNSIEGLSATYVPSEENHITTKKYVDDAKVSKTGDTVNGDLFISASSESTGERSLGCYNIREGERFDLLLGNADNRINFHNSANNPIIFHTTNGLRVRINNEDAIDIVKNVEYPVGRINVFKNIYMRGAGITGLVEPKGATSAATKKYVDESRKKCLVGYIPNLEANNSITGFIASASASSAGHEAYRAFNNLVSGDPWFAGVDGSSAWLQIKCPEPVIIWRLALKVRMTTLGWSLTGSNDGTRFASLLSSSGTLPVGASPTFFNISTTTAYRYYKLVLVEDDWNMNGLEVMQLYVYDT